jgi:hypothetical protein
MGSEPGGVRYVKKQDNRGRGANPIGEIDFIPFRLSKNSGIARLCIRRVSIKALTVDTLDLPGLPRRYALAMWSPFTC